MARRPPAAQTALGPMVIAAAEQHEPPARRLIEDGLAIGFLPPALRLTARACRWRPVRRWMMLATEQRAPGIWGGVLCRKRYADDKVAEAFHAGITQLVVLGAGLDTRAYRLAPSGAQAYEIDLAANITHKRHRLEALYGDVPDHVRLISVDFETDDLAVALAQHGFQAGRPAMFVWEAVTQYLTEDGVRATLAFLTQASPGSRLMFTYLLKDFLDGMGEHRSTPMYKEFVLKQRVWRFGLAPSKVGGLLAEYGWTESEQVGAQDYLTRYLRPAGRTMPVSDLERFVYAEKR
jgi:methyltransferase (TIGR00027 family)